MGQAAPVTDSLRLEDELLCTRRLGGRAKVHTDFMPSPYDNESLKLQVSNAGKSMLICLSQVHFSNGTFLNITKVLLLLKPK